MFMMRPLVIALLCYGTLEIVVVLLLSWPQPLRDFTRNLTLAVVMMQNDFGWQVLVLCRLLLYTPAITIYY